MSGMASVTGFPDGPPVKFGPPIADIAAGMFTATAITSALYAREQDPEHKGQYLGTSMLGGQIAMLTYMAGVYFNTGKVPMRNGNRHHALRHLSHGRWLREYRGRQRCDLAAILRRHGHG